MPHTEDEASTLAGIASGNDGVFERVYRAHKDDLLTLAAFLLRDRHAAEDVLHDVFVGLARRARELRLTGSLKAYLVTSCRNRCRDLLRERVRTRDKMGDLSFAADEVAVDAGGEAETADDAEQAQAVLLELPDAQREVVTLHVYGGLKFREIAEMQGISVNTAQSRYRYAIESMQTRLPGEERGS